MTNPTKSLPQLWFSDLALASLPTKHLRESARRIRSSSDSRINLVVAFATEILQSGSDELPEWMDTETRYLVVVDVPTQAVLRLSAALGLHKPHLRLHASPDVGIVKRFVLAQERDEPWEGIVDAYTLHDLLIVVHADMTIREYPQERLPRLHRLQAEQFRTFEIDNGGSFLYWPAIDTHLGASQLLQAVDPMHLADVEVARYRREKVSLVLLDMRDEWGLNQTDIPGLSDRHVRRLENEEARLTVEAASAFAAAFGMDLGKFLDELGRRLSVYDQTREEEPVSR
ncbi:MAG: DUF2442 domain-containing protein [Gemmatimonadota bacterium]